MNVKSWLFVSALAASSASALASSPIEPVLVNIPGGSFDMGSTQRESTQPIHRVEIEPFSMGKYEVTVAEFRRFIEATNYPVPEQCRHELDGWFKPSSKGNWETNKLTTSEYQPVVCIGWKSADAYVKWLAKETGNPYRLATEAEWEYAARAGTTTDYYFGDDKERTEVCEHANTADLYGESILQLAANTTYYNWDTGLNNCSDNSAYASIVGMYKPNQFGLHDMVSNVLEFLADCYVSGYEGAPTDGSARKDDECKLRSTRGGSWHWNNWPHAFRGSIPEDFAGGVDGFRIAMDGPSKKPSKATQQFLKSLTQAQKVEQRRRALISEIPAPVKNLKLVMQDSSVKLSWDKSEQEGVKGYRVYRNDVPEQMFKLLATNLTNNQFVDSNANAHKYEYTVVAVSNHLQSMYAEPAVKPSGWLSVAERIEAEWAAELNGASIFWSSDIERGKVLTGRGGISNTAMMTYQVEVNKAGTYQLEYRVAAQEDRKGFEIYANHKKQGDNLVAKTGGYNEWQTQSGVKVTLKKGKNILTIKSLDDGWKLNWLSLKES